MSKPPPRSPACPVVRRGPPPGGLRNGRGCISQCGRQRAWGDIPTWISAIITAIYAARAFREQAAEIVILVEENNRRQPSTAGSVFIGPPIRGICLVQPLRAALTPSFWYSDPGGLWDSYDLGMIMPGPVGPGTRQFCIHQ